VNPKGGHIFGELATDMLGKRCSQGEIEESWVELGALHEGNLSLDTTRVDESSAVNKKKMVILSNRMGCKNHSLMCQRLDMANLGAREVRIWMLVVKKNQVKSSMGNGKIRGQQGQLSIPKNAALWRTKGILGHSNPA